jgi:TRAP-type C4-dicarboxylate transport system permease small subunit
MESMKTLRALNIFLLRICRYALIVMVPVMTGIIFVQVVLRYIFFSPLSWAEELSKYLLVWVSCLGSANGIKDAMHVSIEYLKNKFTAFPQQILTLLIHVVTLSFFLFCIIEGTMYAFNGWIQTSAAMGIPMTIPYLSIPVGFAIMLFVSIERFVDDVRDVIKNKIS